MDIIQLDVNLIDTDTNINPRSAIDAAHLDGLLCDHHSTYPPIHVAKLGGDKPYVVVDGYHRLAAALQQQAETIKAVVVHTEELPEEEPVPDIVLKASYEANLKHGLPLSVDARKNYAVMLFDEDPSRSVRDIARACKLSDKTVKTHFEQKRQPPSATTQGEPAYSQYIPEPVDHAKRVVSSLLKFYEAEKALFRASGSPVSEEKRARLLVDQTSVDDTTADKFESLARTLVKASSLIRGSR
jgi:ParB-like nuclease domain